MLAEVYAVLDHPAFRRGGAAHHLVATLLTAM
jgi:hypothetical protein